jgi:hypothetical protein
MERQSYWKFPVSKMLIKILRPAQYDHAEWLGKKCLVSFEVTHTLNFLKFRWFHQGLILNLSQPKIHSRFLLQSLHMLNNLLMHRKLFVECQKNIFSNYIWFLCDFIKHLNAVSIISVMNYSNPSNTSFYIFNNFSIFILCQHTRNSSWTDALFNIKTTDKHSRNKNSSIIFISWWHILQNNQ